MAPVAASHTTSLQDWVEESTPATSVKTQLIDSDSFGEVFAR